MSLLVLDFETYYDREYSLKRLTYAEYIYDPRFHVHGVAIRYPNGNSCFRTDVDPALRELQLQFGKELENVTVVFHNAYFDLYILVRKYGLRVKNFIDTMLLAYHVQGRRSDGSGKGASLRALAGQFSHSEKGMLDFMSGIREPNARQLAELAAYARKDVEITYDAAMNLLPHVTRPEVEIPIMIHTVRVFVEREIAINMNEISSLKQRIIDVTDEGLKNAAHKLGDANILKGELQREDVTKNQPFNDLLAEALTRTGRTLPLKTGKNGLIPATSKKDEAMQELMNDSDPVVAALACARTGKKSEDQLIAKLETLERITRATGGYLPPFLVYGGAHTMRFAGGQKFNIQNLGKNGFGLELRRLLRAKDGCRFIVGDLAQIEARIVAWFADQQDLLSDFKNGVDTYSGLASDVLKEEVRKPKRNDPVELAQYMNPRREMGKCGVLGLGFGMGAIKFMNTLRGNVLTAPLFKTGLLTPIVCRETVQTYRSKYPQIPQLWSGIESGFRIAMDGAVASTHRLTFERRGDLILVWLPSGRALRYFNPRLEPASRSIRYLDEFGEEAEFTPQADTIICGHQTVLYGGKLTENIVQATARDILVECVLRLEARGRSVLFHVHDEIVIEVPETEAEAACAELEEELKRVPLWADGTPINAEVNHMEFYEK